MVVVIQRIVKVVAFGENQWSTNVKSYKSIQILQIYFVKKLRFLVTSSHNLFGLNRFV